MGKGVDRILELFFVLGLLTFATAYMKESHFLMYLADGMMISGLVILLILILKPRTTRGRKEGGIGSPYWWTLVQMTQAKEVPRA